MFANLIAAIALAAQAQPYPTLDIPQDPNALYQVLRTQTLPDGTREIITARTGNRGTTFVKRFVWCDRGIHRVMGNGHSIEEMNAARPAWTSSQTDPNTIAGHIVDYACAQPS